MRGLADPITPFIGSLAKKASNLSVSVTSLKFQPILAISSSSTRSKDWEDVVTAHVNDSYARTWRVQDKKSGRWALDVQDGAVKVSALSVLLTSDACD